MFKVCNSVVYYHTRMDSKTLHVLEYHRIRVRLRGFCDFSASMELALAIALMAQSGCTSPRCAVMNARSSFSTNSARAPIHRRVRSA